MAELDSIVEVATTSTWLANALLQAGWRLLAIHSDARAIELREPGAKGLTRESLQRRTSFVLGRTAELPPYAEVAAQRNAERAARRPTPPTVELTEEDRNA